MSEAEAQSQPSQPVATTRTAEAATVVRRGYGKRVSGKADKAKGVPRRRPPDRARAARRADQPGARPEVCGEAEDCVARP